MFLTIEYDIGAPELTSPKLPEWLKMFGKKKGVQMEVVQREGPLLFECLSGGQELVSLGMISKFKTKFRFVVHKIKEEPVIVPSETIEVPFPSGNDLNVTCHESFSANVLIVGKTGAGKTTYLKTLKNVNHFCENQVVSQTKEAYLHQLCFEVEKKIYFLKVLDTPGFSDTNNKSDQETQTHIQEFVKRGVTSLSMILLVLPMGQTIDRSHIETLLETIQFLRHMRPISYILATHSEGKTVEEKKQWAKCLFDNPDLKKIVKFVNKRFLWGGMIDKHTQGSQRQQQQQNLKQNHLQFLKKAVTAKPISLKSEWEGGGGRGEGGEFFLYESAFKYYRTVDGLLGEIVPLVEQYWALYEKSPKKDQKSEMFDKDSIEKKLKNWREEKENNYKSYCSANNRLKLAALQISQLHKDLLKQIRELKKEGITAIAGDSDFDDIDDFDDFVDEIARVKGVTTGFELDIKNK